MRRFAITFDYPCPFVRNASEVGIRAQEAGASHRAEFRAFSLSPAHLEETKPVGTCPEHPGQSYTSNGLSPDKRTSLSSPR